MPCQNHYRVIECGGTYQRESECLGAREAVKTSRASGFIGNIAASFHAALGSFPSCQEPASRSMCNNISAAMNEAARVDPSTLPKIPGPSQLIMIAEIQRARESLNAQQNTEAMHRLVNAPSNPPSSTVLSPILAQNFLQAPPRTSFVSHGHPVILPFPMGIPPLPCKDYQLQQLISMYCARQPQQDFPASDPSRGLVPEDYLSALATSRSTSSEACSAAQNFSRTVSSSSSRTTISNLVAPISPSGRSDGSLSSCDESSMRVKKVRSQTLEARHALEIYAERPSASPKGVSKRRLAGQVTRRAASPRSPATNATSGP